MRNTATRFLASFLAAAALAGCGGSDGDGPGLTFVRVVNTVPDSPSLSVSADTYLLTMGLPYNTVSGFSIDSFDGDRARRELTVQPVLPGRTFGDAVLQAPVTFSRDTESTLVLTGALQDMDVLVVETPRRRRPLANVYMQFAHAATGVGALDVYVTAPGVDLASTAPLYTVAPRGSTQSVQVPFEDFVIRMTRAGTLDVVFESATVELNDNEEVTTDGSEFLMVVVDTLTPGASPVKVLAGTAQGGSILFPDVNGLSGLRVVHASPDTPAFDAVVGDNFASPIGTGLAYKDASAMAGVASGLVNLNFTVPGSTTEFVFEEEVELAPDNDHTLWLLDEYENLQAVVGPTDRRSISTEAKVRLVHAAPDGDFFSLYLGETAQDPPDRDDRTFIDVRFGTATLYLSVLPDDYKLTLTERFYTPGDRPDDAEETITIGPLDISLQGGDVITLLVLPPETPGGPEVLEIYDDTAM